MPDNGICFIKFKSISEFIKKENAEGFYLKFLIYFFINMELCETAFFYPIVKGDWCWQLQKALKKCYNIWQSVAVFITENRERIIE